MGIALRCGVSFCEVSGRLIFLDIVADRYFALEPEAERAFRDVAGGRSPAAADGQLAGLMRRGLLSVAPDGDLPRPCAASATPALSLLDQALPQASAMSVLGATYAVLHTRLKLRVRGLATVVRQVAQQKAAVRSDRFAPDRLQGIAAAFERSNRLVRSHDQCLVRSLAAASRLAALGISAELVIGVRARPFAAHCWVQHDRWLVNDRHDRVRAYTPILVI